MGNSLETDGRGPTDRQLLGCGAAVLVVAALISTFLLVKATGRLDARVPVVAALVNVGDGLPQRSDVKYHGVLVGVVDSVTPAAHGDPNFVRIDLKPEYAASIPNTVTARVVPSNVFAVSSVQLVDRAGGPANGSSPGPAIAAGAQIPEDTELPTVLFQTTISKLRDVLAATGRGREDKTVGILAAVNAATENRRTELLTSGAQLNRLIDQLDAVVATEPGPTTVSALIDATRGLQQTAPDLLDALHKAVQPMQTLVEQRAQLTTMINGGINTVGTTHTALDNHTDRLVKITSDLTPVLGQLADTSHNWVPAFVKLNQLSDKFFNEVWMPEHDFGNMRVNLSFTPTYTYTRADCPQYAGLKGPSCFTAPLVPTRASLPDVLLPQNYQPPPDLLPPAGTVVGPNGNLVAVGPPLINPNPSLADPNPPLPDWMPPSAPVPGTANPALKPAPAPAPGPDSPLLPAEAAPASFGGNVGPVGSPQERAALSIATGHPASAATQLLLGPIARGTTVSIAENPVAQPVSAGGGR
ncbi:ABC-type transporter Mla subunit MlaD [Mycobacterium frederiksbergense]|uniref:ABC-type transporter Mla subunit MlaD n=1 Tax=Mycolicibacterium frederiksbergense TaxID=117567 RepID=A0ABT6L9H1_9MYCO|nr:MCE family protein [Mycolicibacterium frederiksbergense]MDH6199015.1 ABC-type transporter Mla subunit MlaD [Mycolicibacterium frederiksbergense]